jgi:hypothetical protein
MRRCGDLRPVIPVFQWHGDKSGVKFSRQAGSDFWMGWLRRGLLAAPMALGGLAGFLGQAQIARAMIITPVFMNPDDGAPWTAQQKAVVQQAITDWTSRIAFADGNNQRISINFYFTSAGTGPGTYLTQWQYSETNIAQFPYSPTITHDIAVNSDYLPLDSFSLTGPIIGYDMLTAMEHELGHMFGFAPGAYFDSNVSANKWLSHVTDHVFDPDGLNVPLFPDDAHVNVPGDLMFSTLGQGERRPISDRDLQMLSLAYGYTILPVPECGTLGLLAAACTFLLRRRRQSTAK